MRNLNEDLVSVDQTFNRTRLSKKELEVATIKGVLSREYVAYFDNTEQDTKLYRADLVTCYPEIVRGMTKLSLPQAVEYLNWDRDNLAKAIEELRLAGG